MSRDYLAEGFYHTNLCGCGKNGLELQDGYLVYSCCKALAPNINGVRGMKTHKGVNSILRALEVDEVKRIYYTESKEYIALVTPDPLWSKLQSGEEWKATWLDPVCHELREGLGWRVLSLAPLDFHGGVFVGSAILTLRDGNPQRYLVEALVKEETFWKRYSKAIKEYELVVRVNEFPMERRNNGMGRRKVRERVFTNTPTKKVQSMASAR